MVVSFTQTQTDFTACANSQYCAADPVTIAPVDFEAIDGGTAGTIEQIVLQSPGDTVSYFNFIDNIDSLDGAAGNWTIRLNVTTLNANFTWTKVHLCRLNSSCISQETIGSNLAVGQSLGSTGVKTAVVNGSSVAIGSGDKVVVIYTVNSVAGGNETFGTTPDQNIDSPWTGGAVLTPGGFPRSFVLPDGRRFTDEGKARAEYARMKAEEAMMRAKKEAESKQPRKKYRVPPQSGPLPPSGPAKSRTGLLDPPGWPRLYKD